MTAKKVVTYLTPHSQKKKDRAACVVVRDNTAPVVKGRAGANPSEGASKDSRTPAKVLKMPMWRQDIRVEEVDFIRNLLENDSYVIEPEEIARRMLDELW